MDLLMVLPSLATSSSGLAACLAGEGEIPGASPRMTAGAGDGEILGASPRMTAGGVRETGGRVASARGTLQSLGERSVR